MALNPIPKTYDPVKVEFLLGGVEPYDYAPGTKIAISKTEALLLPQAGVDGAVAIAKNANNLGTLTMSLKNVSDFNDTLMAWMIASDVEGNDSYFFTVYLRDPSSNIGIETFGWIEEQPDFSLSQEVDQLDWVIGLADSRFKRFSGQSVVETIASAAGLL